MIRNLCIGAILLALAASASPASAQHQRMAKLDANGNLDSLIARHAAANNVPEALVRRVIKRESGGNPRVVSKGNFGLMQIKLATARSMGYRGTAAGLLDADTNMTYAVKYLAGAYHAADGNANRAVSYYAGGYYYAAKRKGLPDKTNDNSLNAFASAASGSAPATAAAAGAVKPAKKLRKAQAAGMSVSSSSSLYSGRVDFY
jgi:soluble lytic murein transglycosylase-like protein